MLIHAPHRLRDCQTPPSPFPSNLLAKEGELKLRDKWLQHYVATLLMPESSGSCSPPLLPGWGQWAQIAIAFSCSLATVCKYEQLWQYPAHWLGLGIIRSHSIILIDYLSTTNSRSSPKLMSIESVMTSSHLILCHPQPQAELTFPCPLTRIGGCRQS